MTSARALIASLFVVASVASASPQATRRLEASVPQTNGRFGTLIAADGDTVAVGELPFVAGVTRRITIYRRTATAGWTLVRTLDTNAQALALQGDLLAVSDWARVMLRRRDAGGPDAWGVVATLSAPPFPAFYSQFGALLALEGPYLFATDPTHDINQIFPSQSGAGRLLIFEEVVPDTWVLRKQLVEEGTLELGHGLATDGEIVVTATLSPNHLFVFDRNATGPDQWGLQAEIPVPYTGGVQALSLDGDRLAVGLYAICGAGSVWLLDRNIGGENQWGTETRFLGSTTDCDVYGAAVLLEGRELFVGAPYRFLNDPGRVYVYHQPTGEGWSLARILRASATSSHDEFGEAIARNGNRLLVGAPRDAETKSGAGAMYVFAPQGKEGAVSGSPTVLPRVPVH